MYKLWAVSFFSQRFPGISKSYWAISFPSVFLVFLRAIEQGASKEREAQLWRKRKKKGFFLPLANGLHPQPRRSNFPGKFRFRAHFATFLLQVQTSEKGKQMSRSALDVLQNFLLILLWTPKSSFKSKRRYFLHLVMHKALKADWWIADTFSCIYMWTSANSNMSDLHDLVGK